MRTVMLMVSAWPESGFWDVPLGRGLLAKAGGEANTGFSVGKGEQKVEMTVGDFGAPDVSQRAVGRRGSTSASQDGGIVGSGFRAALSRGSVG